MKTKKLVFLGDSSRGDDSLSRAFTRLDHVEFVDVLRPPVNQPPQEQQERRAGEPLEYRFNMWDFERNETFLKTHGLFLTQNSVHILVVEQQELEQQWDQKEVLLRSLLSSLRFFVPDAAVLIVCAGQVTNHESYLRTEEKLKELVRHLTKYLDLRKAEGDRLSFPVGVIPTPDSLKSLRRAIHQYLEEQEDVQHENNNFTGFQELEEQLALNEYTDPNLCLRPEGPADTADSIARRHDSLLRWAEEGSIVMPTKVVSGPRESLDIIYKPQKLLNILSSFIFNDLGHLPAKFTAGETKRKIKKYKKSGVLTAALLESLMKTVVPNLDYNFFEKFIDISKNSLLLSDYPVSRTNIEPCYYVPCMHEFNNQQRPRQIDAEKLLKFFVSIKCSMFKGVFQKFVCLFLQKAVRNDASSKAFLTPSSASISLNTYLVNLSMDASNKHIVIEVEKPDQERMVKNVIHMIKESLSEFEQMRSDDPVTRLLITCRNGNDRVDFAEIDKLQHTSNTRVPIFGKVPGYVNLEDIDPMYLPRNLAAPTQVPRDPFPRRKEFDVFIAHDWGSFTDANGNKVSNVETARRIHEEFRVRRITAWVDTNQVRTNMDREMMQGIHNSNCFIALVTAEYVNKLRNENENATKEFNYATQHINKKMARIIPVVVQTECLNQETWNMSSLALHTNRKLFYNLTDPASEVYEHQFNLLYELIRSWKEDQ